MPTHRVGLLERTSGTRVHCKPRCSWAAYASLAQYLTPGARITELLLRVIAQVDRLHATKNDVGRIAMDSLPRDGSTLWHEWHTSTLRCSWAMYVTRARGAELLPCPVGKLGTIALHLPLPGCGIVFGCFSGWALPGKFLPTDTFTVLLVPGTHTLITEALQAGPAGPVAHWV